MSPHLKQITNDDCHINPLDPIDAFNIHSKAESCGICGALCPYTHSTWAAADKPHFHVGTLYHRFIHVQTYAIGALSKPQKVIII